jgi:hypothetical protein
MAVRRFVVVATQRSGTTFTALSLQSMGLRCGHEAAFQWRGFMGWGDLDGDSSFYAAPYLDHVAGDEPIVIHQVREPLAAIRALATSGVFMALSPGRHLIMGGRRMLRGKPWLRRDEWFARKHCHAAWDEHGEFARAARYWLLWNRLIEDATGRLELETHRVRVEDLDKKGLRRLAVWISGTHRPPASIATNTNTVQSRFRNRGLLDLPHGLRDEVLTAGERYGYELRTSFKTDA